METKPVSVEEMQQIAETIVGAVRWTRPGVGYCQCPGADLHNNTTQRKDCRVTVVPGRTSEAPTIYCFHTHCAEVVAVANHRLRSAIGKAKVRAGGAASAPRADDRRSARGGAPPGRRPQAAPATTQGQAARTLRTPFFDITPASERSLPEARTLRTDFFPSPVLRESGPVSGYKEDGGSNPSERSEAPGAKPSSEKPSEPSEAAPTGAAAQEGGWRGVVRLERTRERLRPGTVWVNARGAVFQAQRTSEAIIIGRQISGPEQKHEGK